MVRVSDVILTRVAMALAGLTLAGPALGQPTSRFALEFEAGPLWQTVNDIQIPNRSDGSRFSLVDLVGKGPQTAWRSYLTWEINAKHSLRGLYAPLSLTENGVPEGDLRFNGESFSGGQEVSATYKFNSYRLTYSYLWHESQTWRWQIGFTAKIRDAKVQLRQGGVDSTKDDVGFVPLLHLAGRYRLGETWYVNLDLDALAGGPGRAEDVALKLGWQAGSKVAWELGYRTVEGGADVDEVYSFAWLHYVVTSVRLEY
jgi:hypothetical protein